MIVTFLALLAVSNAPAAPSRVCDFVVGFGSACCGPNAPQIEQLENYLKANPDLVTADSRGRGKEGEREFCVHVKNHGDLLAVRNHLARIVSVKAKDKSVPSGGVKNCYEKDAPAVCRDPGWKSADKKR